MYDNILFKKRVKILRKSHNMSVAQLSDVFGKSRTMFSQIELGRMKLPQDFLINLADFFAISLDWLTGRSNEPYSLPVIELQEKKLLDLEKNIILKENAGLFYIKLLLHFCDLKEKYWGNKDSYSLDQRAEVIYAINFWIYACKKIDKPIYSIDEIKEFLSVTKKTAAFGIIKNKVVKSMIDTLAATCTSKRAGTAFSKILYGCVETLDELAYGLVKTNDLRDLCKKCNELG